MAETSLARQLKKLAVPQTTLLLQDKIRASLLFEPREASGIDKDTIYAIGLTGLEELETIEPSFSRFHETLFAESSKNMERSVQDKETNRQLDAIIDKFLTMVSPYFLLRPSHKALEWLIYRFHIHMFNVDSLIATILPFHEARIFVRALQLIDIRDPAGRWHWLQPLQKNGVSLPKSTLITHCYKDLSFMKFICDLVPRILKVYSGQHAVCHTPISFYTVVMIGALENANEITENILSTLMPYLLVGLRSENLDYCTSTYMILCQIANKITIKEEVVNKLMKRVVVNPDKKILDECFLCLLVVCQRQNLVKLPKNILEGFCDNPPLIKQVASLAEQYHILPLLLPLLRGLIPAVMAEAAKTMRTTTTRPQSKKTWNYRRLLIFLFSRMTLTCEVVTFVVRLLFELYIKYYKLAKRKPKTYDNRSLQTTTRKLLSKLENRFPEYCDQAVEKTLKKMKPQKKTLVQKMINRCSSGTKHHVLEESNTTLFLSINHPSAARRIMSVKTLVTMLQKQTSLTDLAFVCDSLLQRLHDDDPEVVKAVLQLQEKLYTLLPKTELYYSLCQLLKKIPSKKYKKWLKVKVSILKLLCDNEEAANQLREDILPQVITHLLPLKSSGIEIVRVILSLKLAQLDPILSAVASEVLEKLPYSLEKEINDKELLKIGVTILKSFSNATATAESSARNQIIKTLVEGSESGLSWNSTILTFFLSNVCTRGLKMHYDDEMATIALKMATKWIPKSSGLEKEANWISCLRKGLMPLNALVQCLKTVVESSSKDGSEYLRRNLFIHLTEFASDKKPEISSRYRDLLGLYLKLHFKDASGRIRFLSSFWTESNKWLQIRTLYMSAAILAAGFPSSFFEEGSEEIIRLLSSLILPVDVVREATLKCMQRALEMHGGNSTPFRSLFEYLVEHSEEIRADENQMPQLMSVWLTDSLNNAPLLSGVRTRSRSVKDTATQSSIVLNDLLEMCKNPQISVQLKNSILVLLKDCKSEFILSQLLVVVNDELKSCENLGKVSPLSASFLRLLLVHYNATTAPSLASNDAPSYETLERAIRCTAGAETLQDNIQQISLKLLSKKFFSLIPSREVRQGILDLILDLYVECENSAIAEQQFKTLKNLSTDCKLLVKLLRLSDQAVGNRTVKEVRLSRVSDGGEGEDGDVSVLEKKEWKRAIAVLEILQAKDDLTNAEVLVPTLFDLLNRSLEMESGPRTEYVRQLVLSSLNNCFHQTQGSDLREQQMQVELAVHCIRISTNPQTQQLALALLNTAAVLFPEHVLHNIMAIFTFMGTSLVRQDDSYSFQMTLKTVDTIIPALLQASQHQTAETKTEDVIAAVTRVFVDAFRDIPQHRRIPLFSRLIATLGPNQYLWLPLGQLFDFVVSRPKQDSTAEEKQSTVNLAEEIEFCISLCHNFKPSVQVKSCLRIVEYISLLPMEKDEQQKDSSELPFQKVFDVKLHSEKQLRHFKYVAVDFLSRLLSSQTFISQVADLNEKASSRMENLFQKVLEATLQYIQQVATHQSQIRTQSHSGKFWKSLLLKLYELMDKVNSLLPGQQFVAVIRGLMSHPLPSVRRKAMEMLNSKLLHQHDFFCNEDAVLLMDLVKPLAKAAKQKKGSESDDRDESVLNQQTALLALKLLCKSVGPSNPAPFKKILTIVVKLLKRSHHPQLTSSALLCLAEICHALKEHCVPFLNQFMDPLLVILKDLKPRESDDLLQLSVMTAIHRLVENLSPFLSSFIPTLLTQVCLLISGYPEIEVCGNTGALQLRLRAVRDHLARNVPLRVLLPAATVSYRTLEKDRKMAIGPLMAVMREKMSYVEKEELNDHLLEIEDFFLLALDFRNSWSKGSLDDVNKVEASIVLALQSLILKLSETTFRPFFYKIYDWATRDEDEKDRLLTFYCLTDSLAQKLKSIFVLFASHFVSNAASLLDLTNNSKTDVPFFGDNHKSLRKSCQLCVHIHSTLQHCFLHDNKHLANKDCFGTLMQPLVDQIENTIGDEEEYKKRMDESVSACLAQFAVAAADDSCWKPLNYQILLKTRSSSSLVRFAALQVVCEVVRKLGENYMVLLPESIPFLAELMEDESFEVEQQCQKVVAEMEQIFGESLTKYF